MPLPFNALSVPDAVNVRKARTPSEVEKDIVDFLTRFENELSAKWPTTDGTWPFRSMADVMVCIPQHHMKEIDDLYTDTQLADISPGARIARQIRLVEALESLGNFFEYDEVVMTDTKGQYTEKMDVLEYLTKAGMWWPIDFNAPKGTKYIEGREILKQMTVDTHPLDRTPVPIWDTESLKRWCGAVWPLIDMKDVAKLNDICAATRQDIMRAAGLDLYDIYRTEKESMLPNECTDEKILAMILESEELASLDEEEESGLRALLSPQTVEETLIQLPGKAAFKPD